MEICDNDHEVRLLKFVLEEVELVLRSKHIRRYSVELLMMSYILHATSPRAYKRLLEEELLVLPSLKTLKKITMRLDRKSGSIHKFPSKKLKMQQKQEKKGLPFKKSFSEQNLFMLTCLSISCQLKMMSL